MQVSIVAGRSKRLKLVGMCRSPEIVSDIETTIPATWWEPKELGRVAWMGAFTRNEVLIAMRVCTT